MRGLSGRVTLARQRLDLTQDRLAENAPEPQIFRQRVDELKIRAQDSWARYLALKREAMRRVEAELRALGPHNILERGYVIARDSEGKVITKAATVKPRSAIELTFADGTVETEAKSINATN